MTVGNLFHCNRMSRAATELLLSILIRPDQGQGRTVLAGTHAMQRMLPRSPQVRWHDRVAVQTAAREQIRNQQVQAGECSEAAEVHRLLVGVPRLVQVSATSVGVISGTLIVCLAVNLNRRATL